MPRGKGGRSRAESSRVLSRVRLKSSPDCPAARPIRDWSRRRERNPAVTARSDAYDVIRHDAIAGIERRRLQPDRQLAEVHAEIERAVDDYQRNARLGEEVPLGDAASM